MDQAELPPHLKIEFDATTGDMQWGLKGPMPIDKLIGTLELIKSVLLDEQKRQMMIEHQQKASKQVIVPTVNGIPRIKF